MPPLCQATPAVAARLRRRSLFFRLHEADATIADYHRSHATQQLGLLERLEGATPEQMEAWTPEQHAEYFAGLSQLREEREEHLGRLPIAERRDWERRLGL
jgi:hypothetical protein